MKGIPASSQFLAFLVGLMLTGSGVILAAPEARSSGAAHSEFSPPKLRLDDTARPTRYFLDLTVIPDRDTFTGAIDIDMKLSRRTSLLWLNATDLTFREARLQADGRSIAARPAPAKEDFVAFVFDRPVGPGAARLHVEYKGRLSEKEMGGLFRRREGEQWYAFSQFEPIDARRAFPCFDEPIYKVPWQLTLHVKREHLALSNTSILSAADEPDGMKTVRFARTKPLPSYLVALAVGPFDIVDAGTAGRKRTRIRVITPRGRAGEASYPVRTTGKILARLEDYFDRPYPYEKLDLVAVPQFPGMENPGLVTGDQRWLLARPEDQSIRYQRRYAWFCAHELAHQWFGNLVTMAWWDDTWLNEGFATWLEGKITDQWKPEWEGKLETLAFRSSLVGYDSLITARKIRQPIESKHDISNAFDGITYDKGATILEMFEAWIGEEKFRRGIHRYIREHAWGNATSEDFLAAMSREAGRDISSAFATFIEQTGVPVVSVELKCEGSTTPRLLLTQEWSRPVGSPRGASRTWQIPIRIMYGVGNSRGTASTLLTVPQAEIPVGEAGRCPDWVMLNPGGTGYYRVRYRGDLLQRLLKEDGLLSLRERLGLLVDINALVATGELPVGESFALFPKFVSSGNRHLISATADTVYTIDILVPESLHSSFQRFVRETYGPKARELGWQPRPGEKEETQLLRARLLGLAARMGEDAVLVAEGASLARRWLDDRKALAPDLIWPALRIAAHHGDRVLFDRYRAEARKTRDPEERRFLLLALGAFRDPTTTREALTVLLTDEFHPDDAVSILWGAGDDPRQRRLRYEFVKQNFDALVAKFPEADTWPMGASLPFVAASFCDEESLADVEAFFKERSSRFTGGPRNLAQVLEQIRLNIALKKAQLPSLEAFLQRYSPSAPPANARRP